MKSGDEPDPRAPIPTLAKLTRPKSSWLNQFAQPKQGRFTCCRGRRAGQALDRNCNDHAPSIRLRAVAM